MRTNKIKTFAICLLAAVLCGSAAGQNPTTSELLQKGIYLQETVGDLDGAIKVYRQIMQMARQSRANAAQAEYRLGMCLLKKGRQAEATETFQKLIREYPEQTDMVAKARPYAESAAHTADTSNPTDPFAFTPIGDMEAMRYEHTAVLLPNGQVLIVGGMSPSTKAELYDPAVGAFRATDAMKETRRWVNTTTALPNGKVLIAGGSSCHTAAGCPLTSAELYDPETGSFAFTGAMSVGRYAQAATVLPNGKILITGGIGNNSEYLTSAELYDPLTGSFTLTGAMNKPRSRHTATVLPNGKVLIAGGFSGSARGGYLAAAELYDPSTGSFTVTGSMIMPRMSHTATLLPNGKVLITGGVGPGGVNGYHATAELYDPSTGVFTATGTMATPRVGHTATLLPSGKVLIIGGLNTPVSSRRAVAFAATELYDPSAGTFTPAAAMATDRSKHSATLLPNGKVLVAGGLSPEGGALSTAELYTFTPLRHTAKTSQHPAPPISRPGELKLLPAPWKDGEVLEYTRRKKADSTGFEIWYSYQLSKNHASNWLLESHHTTLFDRLEFDPQNMQPVSLFEAVGSHSFQLNYQAQAAQIIEGDGKPLAPIALDGPAFDAREIPAILPRLPWIKGYKVTLPIFWSDSGRVTDYEFAVTGEENIKVPAGEFHCYRIEENDLADRMFAVETFWISTDAARMIVKNDRGDWTDELAVLFASDPEEKIYQDAETGASFKVPAGWMVEKPPRGAEFVRWYLTDLHSAAFVTLRLFPHEAGDFTPEQMRFDLEKSIATGKNVAVQPGSWQMRQVNRYAIVACIQELYHSRLQYRAWVRTGTSAVDMFADADVHSFDALRPAFDAIVDSLVIK